MKGDLNEITLGKKVYLEDYEDGILPTNALAFSTDGEKFTIYSSHSLAINPLKVGAFLSRFALKQVANRSGVAPWVLHKRLSLDDASTLLTKIFAGENRGSTLVRYGEGHVRALLSPDYIPVDLGSCVDALSEATDRILEVKRSHFGDRFSIPYGPFVDTPEFALYVIVTGSETGVSFPEVSPMVVFKGDGTCDPACAIVREHNYILTKRRLADLTKSLNVAFDLAVKNLDRLEKQVSTLLSKTVHRQQVLTFYSRRKITSEDVNALWNARKLKEIVSPYEAFSAIVGIVNDPDDEELYVLLAKQALAGEFLTSLGR